MRTEFYNGILYQIEKVYSNPFYGYEALYKIYTEEGDNFIAKTAILSYLNTENKPSQEEYNKKDNSFMDYLKGYYTLTYNEKEKCYEFFMKEGYDD